MSINDGAYAVTVQAGAVREYIDRPFASAARARRAMQQRRTWLSQGASIVVMSRDELLRALGNYPVM